MKVKTKNIILIVFCCILGLFVLGTIYIVIDTQMAIRNTIIKAQKQYPISNDDVSSLIEYLNNKSNDLRDRNMVVWTLGRIKAERSLKTLESYYTGEQCDHRAAICQYEIVKALNRCGTKMEIHPISFYDKKR
jgi:hypothetical protein